MAKRIDQSKAIEIEKEKSAIAIDEKQKEKLQKIVNREKRRTAKVIRNWLEEKDEKNGLYKVK